MSKVKVIDPLKVFYGQLNHGLSRWEFEAFLREHNIPMPNNVWMKHNNASLSCAFATFDSPEMAKRAMGVHGIQDTKISPSWVKAMQS